jgi:hypothetical protein
MSMRVTSVAGWAVLCCAVGVLRDHDLEGMTDGFDAGTAYGQIEGYEDPSMGWSRSVAGLATTHIASFPTHLA